MSKYDYRKTTLIMDIECYPNYFLVAFRSVNEPEKTKRFEMRGIEDLSDGASNNGRLMNILGSFYSWEHKKYGAGVVLT